MDAIDCDVHCAPASYDELFPYLSDYWRQYIEEAGIRLNGLANAYPRGVVAPAPSTYSDLSERLLRGGECRFAVLNCLTGFETHRNPYFSAAVASAINDWMREEFLYRDSRLRASLAVSTLSPDDAVSEIERWGRTPVSSRCCCRSAATCPGVTRTTTRSSPPPARPASRWGCTPGVAPARRPRPARVVVTECGFAWLAPLLWRFDKDWKGVWREVPWVKREPSEYAREHFLFTTAPAHLPSDSVTLGQLFEMMDVPGMLVFASDYPHEHGDRLSVLLDQLSEDERRRVMFSNAAAVYGLT